MKLSLTSTVLALATSTTAIPTPASPPTASSTSQPTPEVSEYSIYPNPGFPHPTPHAGNYVVEKNGLITKTLVTRGMPHTVIRNTPTTSHALEATDLSLEELFCSQGSSCNLNEIKNRYQVQEREEFLRLLLSQDIERARAASHPPTTTTTTATVTSLAGPASAAIANKHRLPLSNTHLTTGVKERLVSAFEVTGVPAPAPAITTPPSPRSAMFPANGDQKCVSRGLQILGPVPATSKNPTPNDLHASASTTSHHAESKTPLIYALFGAGGPDDGIDMVLPSPIPTVFSDLPLASVLTARPLQQRDLNADLRAAPAFPTPSAFITTTPSLNPTPTPTSSPSPTLPSDSTITAACFYTYKAFPHLSMYIDPSITYTSTVTSTQKVDCKGCELHVSTVGAGHGPRRVMPKVNGVRFWAPGMVGNGEKGGNGKGAVKTERVVECKSKSQ